MRLVSLLGLAVMVSACDGILVITPTGPSASFSPIPVPSPSAPRTFFIINLGQRIEVRLLANGDGQEFEFTAPADGVLVARVTWSMKDGRVELWYGTRGFVGDGLIVARIPVIRGHKYYFSVDDGAPRDYGGLNLPFVLETSLE